MNQDKTKYKMADFIDQEIPSEIIEQLKIADRIKFYLNPTTTSAVSSSAQTPDKTPDSLSTEADVNNEIDDLINDVDELENLVEQLEDMLDEHLKDMSIPPANQRISDAVKQLDPGGDGNITKDVLDKASAIMNYLPLMSMGQDPVLGALVGDGTIDGPYMECNEITSALADQFKTLDRDDPSAATSIKDQSSNIADSHEKRMENMMLETLLMLWWNMLWPKTVVDPAIINPIRLAIANPLDGLIGFFHKKRFRKKKKKWIKDKGPVNKLLTKLRIRLLCMPYKIYPRYKPMVDILDVDGKKVNCFDINGECPPEKDQKQFTEDNDNAMSQMGEMMDEIGNGEFCISNEELLDKINTQTPEGLGASPECTKAAKVVLDAVLSDALTPPSNDNTIIKDSILKTGALNNVY